MNDLEFNILQFPALEFNIPKPCYILFSGPGIDKFPWHGMLPFPGPEVKITVEWYVAISGSDIEKLPWYDH